MTLKFNGATLTNFQAKIGFVIRTLQPGDEFACSPNDAEKLLADYPNDFEQIKKFSVGSNKLFAQGSKFTAK